MRYLCMIFLLFVAGCSSGAVVFAPTPAPPDLSPLRYDHPTGAFSVSVPRHWPVFTQNTTTLAAASFAPPGALAPALTFAVIHLDEDTSEFGSIIDRYQTSIRTDIGRYKEESREAMGDGSWRLSGLRTIPGGATRQVNTFIERNNRFVGVIEAVIPDDPALMDDFQTIINTFEINPDSGLEPTSLSVLVALAANSLDVLNVAAWTTPEGVFFITGEIANHGTVPITELPVRAVLYTQDGLPVAEAADVPMNYAVLPGGFAPFSLRFGQGQPALTQVYELILGDEAWTPQPDAVVYGPDDLSWIDDSAFNEDGTLVISGTVTNIGSRMVYRPRVIATVFNNFQNVIAAGFADMAVSELSPNESADFQIVIPEIGGDPAQYIVNVQALPEA